MNSPRSTGDARNIGDVPENHLDSLLTSRRQPTSRFGNRVDDSIVRSLMSNSGSRDMSSVPKRNADGIISSRQKKKRTSSQPALNAKTAGLLQSIVPKLGPTVCFMIQDVEQIRKATEAVRSGNRRSVAYGLNYLMAWSLGEKNLSWDDAIERVFSVLIDFLLKGLSAESTTTTELFGKDSYVFLGLKIESESSLYSSMVSQSMMSLMAAGLILKNMVLSLEKSSSTCGIGSQILPLILYVLTREVPFKDLSSKRHCFVGSTTPRHREKD